MASPDGIPDSIVAQPDPQRVSRLFTQYFPGATRVTAAGPPQRFGGGYLYRFDTISQGVGLRVHIYLTGLSGRGVGVLLAIASPALMARREVAIAAVAASLALPPAGDIAEQWIQRLRGRKLYLFNGHSSTSNSGGMNSQKTLFLAADGAYQFHRSSSVSIYASGLNGSSASQSSDRGSWRIYQSDTRVLLELVSAQGTTENIVLTSQGAKILLNGRQWLVGD